MNDEILEVSKVRLAMLENVGKMASELWNDDKVGLTIKERWKEKHPEANVPEVVIAQNTRKVESDLSSKLEAKEKAIDAKIDAWEKKQLEKERLEADKISESAFTSEVEATRKKYQLSAEGMEKVFSRMKEKNNPDVEAAAAWVTDHEPKAAPLSGSNYSAQNLDVYGSGSGDKAWETLNRNPWDGKFADMEISKITQDFANGRGDRYGPNGMGGEL